VTLMTSLFAAIRLMQGAGVAFARLATFACLSDAFSESRGFVLGSATSMIALGFMVGPPFGGALFSLSGFRAPFVVLSVLVLLCTAPVLWLWPSSRREAPNREKPTQGLTAADSAAADSDAMGSAAADSAASADNQQWQAQDGSGTRSAGQSPEQGGKRRPLPAQRPTLCELVRLLPTSIWAVALTSFVFESKWAWWDIYVTSHFFVGEYYFSIQTASFHISLIATTFAIGCPLGGLLGDRLGDRRTRLIYWLLAGLSAVYISMGPYQLSLFGPIARRVLLYVYLLADGGMSCLVEPQLVPSMLMFAEQSSMCGGAGPNEHLTNFVTSLGQFAMNAGAVVGPFLAVPLIETVGFRGALAAWGVSFAIVTVLGGLQFGTLNCRQRSSRPLAPRHRVGEARDATAAVVGGAGGPSSSDTTIASEVV